MKFIYLLLALFSVTYSQSIQDTDSDIVIDTNTNLIWQDTLYGDNYIDDMEDWVGAIKYCEELVLANKNDWRLPNINELSTLYDKDKGRIRVNFKNKNSRGLYWSSTTIIENPEYAYAISLENGYSGNYNKANFRWYARCVRLTDNN